MKLRLGNSAILAYRRLPYRLWYAIAEFVDNSTDAYLRGNNKNLLDKIDYSAIETLWVEYQQYLYLSADEANFYFIATKKYDANQLKI